MPDDVELEDLYTRAARRLKVLAAGEALSAEDREVFAGNYGGVYAMLEGRGLAQWGDDDPIPQRFFLPVRDLLAEMSAGEFGQDFAAPWALPELSRQVTPDYRYDETRYQEY